MSAPIERTDVDTTAVLTINQPHKRNALSMTEVESLTEMLDEAGRDPQVRGVVLTGRGAFCAGADLKSVVRGVARALEELHDEIEAVPQGLIRTLLNLPVPTVAAIDGAAIGMGMDIALACDSRLISETGWLLQGWGRVGLIPGTGGLRLLQRLNSSALWSMLEHQQPIGAEEADRLGIAESVTGPAIDAAIARAAALAALPKPALDAYVSMQRQPVLHDLEDHMVDVSRVQAGLLASDRFASTAGHVVSGTQPDPA